MEVTALLKHKIAVGCCQHKRFCGIKAQALSIVRKVRQKALTPLSTPQATELMPATDLNRLTEWHDGNVLDWLKAGRFWKMV
jgi:hypothetical protein